MTSFTGMSPEAESALIAAIQAKGEHVELSLNVSDATKLVGALFFAWGYSDEHGDWAGDFVSGLAESYGIEFV